MYSDYAEPVDPGDGSPGGETPSGGGTQSGSGSGTSGGGVPGSALRSGNLAQGEDNAETETTIEDTDPPTTPSNSNDNVDMDSEATDQQQKTEPDEEPINWLAVIGIPVLAIAVLGGAVVWWRHNNAV
jgi:hypothetical protein